MRLTALLLAPYVLPLRRPFQTARGTLTERRGFVVRAEDDAGNWGMGEAAPLPAFGTESPEDARQCLVDWARRLPDRELPPLPEGYSELSAALAPDRDAPPCPAALHGLELALLDLAARERGVPLARLLHPQAAGEVPVNATLSGEAPAQAAEQARTALAAGYGTLKLKVGVGGEAADEARVRAVREAAGSGPRLRLDANGTWEEAQALRLLTRWQRYDLEYVEQPVPPEDEEALCRLEAESPVPVAADESVRSLADAHRLVERRAVRVLILKPMVLGGLLPTLRIAGVAARAGVAVVVTTMLEGAYGRSGALHVAAAIQAQSTSGAVPRLACGLATGSLLARDLLAEPPVPAGGCLAVSPRPGLGLPPWPAQAFGTEGRVPHA